MEQKKEIKISLKTAIILICLILVIIGIFVFIFIKKNTSNSKNDDIVLNSTNFITTPLYNYCTNYTLSTDSLGIFNKLGISWVQVDTYVDYLNYYDKIKNIYTDDKYKISTKIDENFFDKGKVAIIEYSASTADCLDIDATCGYGNHVDTHFVRPELKILYNPETKNEEKTYKSKLIIITAMKYDQFEEPIVTQETEKEYNNRINWVRDAFNLTSDIKKPIIYLYPEKDLTVNVKLGNPDKITCSYPKYTTGWNVLAKPNGDLIDLDTSKNLYALYYESENTYNYKLENDGFVLKGEDSATFLEEKLKMLGLTDRESEEFIVYWLPKLEANPYNYIRFATKDEIDLNMPLDINPKPDTIIRILMTFKGLEKPIDVTEQKLQTPKRTGFTAVEWGGTEIK